MKLVTTSLATALAAAVLFTACDDDDDREFFVRDDLVSDLPDRARTEDPLLVDPWGLASGPDTFFYVANRGTGTVTVYDGEGAIVFIEQDGDDVDAQLVVDVPPPAGAAPDVPAAATGAVFNRTDKFEIQVGDEERNSDFLFSTQQGTIAGWKGELAAFEAFRLSETAGASYTSLATTRLPQKPRLYATDFRNGRVDVFQGNFEPDDDLGDDPFIDPSVPEDLSPIGVSIIDDDVYVTYARVDEGIDPEPGPGLGAVSIFERDGELKRTLVVGEPLNAPIGVAETPNDWGPFSGDILVANHGDGVIRAFDEDDGTFLGPVVDQQGKPFVIEGLRFIRFGNDNDTGERDQLFFTAGIEGGNHGLLGRIDEIEVDHEDPTDSE